MTTRRDFLKCSALLGATVSCTSLLGKDPTPVVPVLDPAKTLAEHAKEILPVPKRRTITIPDVDGFKVLKGDFHMHTLFSDGLVMPKDRVSEAVANGLDIIAITDHIEYRPFFGGKGKFPLQDRNDDYNFSYELAKPDADARKLILVRGTEITKKQMPPGHFNALFIQDANPIAAAVDDWRQMLQVAADQKGFLLWNHPGWVSKSGGLEPNQPLCFTKEHEEVWKKGLMHGIEVFNGSEYYPIVSDWCNQHDLAIIADSDIHPSEANRYGLQNMFRPMTLILAKERSHESIKEAFFDKRTIGWAANRLWGRELWMKSLFRSCVKQETASDGVHFTNRSDLPCELEYAGQTFDLAPQGTVELKLKPKTDDSFSVTNWIVGWNQPLKIPFGG